jgi:hypothetical protein
MALTHREMIATSSCRLRNLVRFRFLWKVTTISVVVIL